MYNIELPVSLLSVTKALALSNNRLNQVHVHVESLNDLLFFKQVCQQDILHATFFMIYYSRLVLCFDY